MFIVKVEFKRIQTFLFSVPKLKEMVGANVLLGTTIRSELTKLVTEIRGNEHQTGEILYKVNTADSDDPIDSDITDMTDDPQHLFKKGVLSRDGGHFIAFFDGDKKAELFKKKAESLINGSMPELDYSVTIYENNKDWDPNKPIKRENIPWKPYCSQKEKGQISFADSEISLVELPQFQVCQESGNGPAVKKIEREDPKNRCKRIVSYISKNVEDKRACLSNESACDITSLFAKKLIIKGKAPTDFEQLCSGDYLAVIHADGNSMGDRFNKQQNEAVKSIAVNGDRGGRETLALELDVNNENFWHKTRVSIRKALNGAILDTFGKHNGQTWPFQILMLGGDDLLLICQAKYALNFVVNYAKKLKESTDCITIGAGVAIAKHTFPFHRLHTIAEKLAESSKRLYRALDDKEKQSVVDWMVITDSWCDDPAEFRKKNLYKEYTVDGESFKLCLSSKPYRVIHNSDNQLIESLEGILDHSEKINDAVVKKTMARSQLRYFCGELHKGRFHGQAIYQQLKPELKKLLKEIIGSYVPWKKIGSNDFVTTICDTVEVFEITRLGKAGL